MAPKAEEPRTGRTPWYRRLFAWVWLGMAAGALVGWASPDAGRALEPLGDGFVGLMTMALAPIVFCMVVSGITSVGSFRRTGRIAGKALLYFELTTTTALLFGLLAVNLLRPGDRMHADADALRLSDEVASRIEPAQDLAWHERLLHAVPTNVVDSFARGEVLQVLVFAVLFGVALTALGERGRGVAEGVERLGEALFGVVRIVMYAAPLGAFGAMAYTVGAFGTATLHALGWLIGVFYVTSAVFVVVVLGGVVALVVGLNPWHVLRHFREETLTALGASSSDVAVPGVIRRLRTLGVPRAEAGVTVGAGYSFNLDGTCVYLTLSAMFLAQALGLDLSFGEQVGLVVVMLLTSKGTAGVTGGGFVMLASSLSSSGVIPVAAVMIVFGVDRFMSECRAVVNVLGNAVAGLVVSRWEGTLDRERAAAVLRGEAAPVDTAALDAAGDGAAAEDRVPVTLGKPG
ncbi:cation:dicarboxylate symporter family transporter [Streptomyces hainanensis]|uniref:Cation:dicarboxylase symporter family transporter n=1 Tax=Streptomyces hainanensis TaxID=402648 RepID=A0A4R4TNX7_9ACTN|nr:cation:dicarboxylase symporter family transporter [Streptomyces hainanensis]TDC77604.1 cation:dicarboxylase symporter family transporter [Streptomyces hainanensis]